MSGDEARAAARRRIGNPLRLREQSREPWTFATVETFGYDVRHALRLMRRDPAFTFTALATLALGIGLNTAIFSAAYGVLWRPLPYPNSDRLVIVSSAQQTETGVRTFSTWAPVTYEALRPRVTTLDHLAAYTSSAPQLTGRGEPIKLSALDVSPNFFVTLGVTPARGRAFLTGAAEPDDDRSAIVSERLWRTSLKADPAIVGQSITIDGLPRTVVGVLPPDFSFRPVVGSGTLALPEADIFLPNRWPGDTGRNAFLFLLGRMKSGVTQKRAEAELTALVNDSSIVPGGALGTEGALAPNVRTRARAVGLQEYGTESVRTLLLILLGAVSFVLLIACVNVANLQMARLSARRGELSVRMALGAGRRRIVRQLLTEAVVLSLLGAAFGVMLAQIAIDVTLPLVPQFALPRLGGIVIDARVMAFCLGLSLVSTLLIGLVPALRVSGAAFGEGLALHAGDARTTGDRQGERLRTLLVAGQIAMTLVLLIGAGLLIHSFVRLTSVSPRFESSGRDGVVQTVKVTLPPRLYDGPERIHAFARGVLDRVEWLTVVGVVPEIRQMRLDRDVQPMIYVPFQQERGGVIRFVSFVARTATPASVVEGIRAEIRRAAPDLAIESTATMDETVAASVAPARLRKVLLVLFATTATLIATCGIYGLMAYAVTQRRREIGVRMALGAERRDVLRLVLTRALRTVVAGLIVGLAGAAAVTCG